MRRILATLVFAIAAAAATAAGSGVVVAPHVDPPGTPAFHSHVLAAYRLPIFLTFLRARLDPHQGILSHLSLFDVAGGLVLALLALTAPRLPRPVLLPIASFSLTPIGGAQWRSPRSTGPPRGAHAA